MKKFRNLGAGLLLIVFMLVAVGGCGQPNSSPENTNQGQEKSEQESLLVLSAAGLRKPMDEIGKVFEEKYGVKIEYTYAGSAQNLSQIELAGQGDVYVPGDIYYGKEAEKKGLIKNMAPVAYHIPVIAVPKDNPANIETLADLGKPGVKVVLGDEKSAAIGKLCVNLFEKNGLSEAIAANTIAKAATVNELVVYITMNQADASVIWEDNVMGVENIIAIPIPEEQNMIKTIPVCIIKNTPKTELAQKFADFVASDEGKAIYQKHGFKTVE